MKIEFSVEDNQMLYDVLDGMFVSLLRHELKNSTEFLESVRQHPDDVKQYKKNIKACKVLLEYYGGLNE
jgi:hypothetical protein